VCFCGFLFWLFFVWWFVVCFVFFGVVGFWVVVGCGWFFCFMFGGRLVFCCCVCWFCWGFVVGGVVGFGLVVGWVVVVFCVVGWVGCGALFCFLVVRINLRSMRPSSHTRSSSITEHSSRSNLSQWAFREITACQRGVPAREAGDFHSQCVVAARNYG